MLAGDAAALAVVGHDAGMAVGRFSRALGYGQSLAGRLEVRGQVQLFNLPVAEAGLGKPFSIAVDGDGTVRPVLELLSPAGVVLTSGPAGVSSG